MTYQEAINHIRKYKNFYSIKQIAERMNIAPSMLRNIVDERPIKNGTRKHYVQKMPEHHKVTFVEVVTMLTSVEQIEKEWSEQLHSEPNLFSDLSDR